MRAEIRTAELLAEAEAGHDGAMIEKRTRALEARPLRALLIRVS